MRPDEPIRLFGVFEQPPEQKPHLDESKKLLRYLFSWLWSPYFWAVFAFACLYERKTFAVRGVMYGLSAGWDRATTWIVGFTFVVLLPVVVGAIWRAFPFRRGSGEPERRKYRFRMVVLVLLSTAVLLLGMKACWHPPNCDGPGQFSCSVY